MTHCFKIKNITLPHQLILAPMCGITNLPFRLICKELGAGLVFNQMVSAKAIIMGDEKSHGMLKFETKERPIAMQVFGNNAEVLAQSAKIIQDTGCDILDLNLGCPARKIVNDGGGSALLNDEKKLIDILKKMRRSLEIPFTIKMRAGWDEKSLNALQIAKLAENEGVDAITIHARTRAQGYSGKSNWDLIRQIKEEVLLPVIGNGDVKNASDAYRMMQETGCDAVMTGRAAFQNPWIFKNFVDKNENPPALSEIKDMIFRHYAYSFEHFGQKKGLKIMRKFICAYTKGMRDGSKLRNAVVRMEDFEKIRDCLESFFR